MRLGNSELKLERRESLSGMEAARISISAILVALALRGATPEDPNASGNHTPPIWRSWCWRTESWVRFRKQAKCSPDCGNA